MSNPFTIVELEGLTYYKAGEVIQKHRSLFTLEPLSYEYVNKPRLLERDRHVPADYCRYHYRGKECTHENPKATLLLFSEWVDYLINQLALRESLPAPPPRKRSATSLPSDTGSLPSDAEVIISDNDISDEEEEEEEEVETVTLQKVDAEVKTPFDDNLIEEDAIEQLWDLARAYHELHAGMKSRLSKDRMQIVDRTLHHLRKTLNK